jgi:O-antigen/teichoic acid export membrane protein
LLSSAAVLVSLVVGLALDQGISRFFIEADDEAEKKRIASSVLIYSVLVFGALVPLASPLAGWVAEDWLAGQVPKSTAILVLFFIWVHSIFVVGVNQLRYTFKSVKFALCQIGNVIISTGLSVLFVFFLEWGVAGVFLGQSIGQFIFGIVAIYLGRQHFRFTFHWPSFRKLLIYSLPLVPGTLSFFLMQYMDRIFLNELKALHEVGVYSIGARLASLVNLFLSGFQAAWWPIVMETYRDDGAAIRFRKVFEFFLFSTLFIMLALSLFSKEALLLLTTEQFSKGYVVVPLLVMSAVLSSIAAYFSFGIQIEQKSMYRLAVNIGAVVVNCILNMLLIPQYGIVGAATATAATYLLLAIISMTISQRLFFVPYRWIRVMVGWVLIFGLCTAFTNIHTGLSLGNYAVKITVLLIALIALSKIFDVDFRQILNVRSIGLAKTAPTQDNTNA